jgi:hypothetical protein
MVGTEVADNRGRPACAALAGIHTEGIMEHVVLLGAVASTGECRCRGVDKQYLKWMWD